MVNGANHTIRKVTTELGEELLQEMLDREKRTEYRATPHPDADPRITWRVQLQPTFDSASSIGLDINGEITLGRGDDAEAFVGLFNAEDAEQLGVSRRHILLRPSASELYVIDLGSTNGTRLNGRPIGVKMPYPLSDGDTLAIGQLECTVQIVKRPRGHTENLRSRQKDDLADVLLPLAKAITSQQAHTDVIDQTLDMVLSLTQAGEASIWLVDEFTGEIFLEARKGEESGDVSRLPLNDSLPGRVVATGEAFRVNRGLDGEPIKVKTGFLVEAVIYVPLTVAEVTFGVLSAVHREGGRTFSQDEERLMATTADIAAIAIQNARRYTHTHRALQHTSKTLTALHVALQHDLAGLVKALTGYAGLLDYDTTGPPENDTNYTGILGTVSQMSDMIERITGITSLYQDNLMQQQPVDLITLVERAVEDSAKAAHDHRVTIKKRLSGEPYIIQGDPVYLYKALTHLLDNAVRFSPQGSEIRLSLVFQAQDVVIRIADQGPGIPESDLPHIFEQFYRSGPKSGSKVNLGLGLEFTRLVIEGHRGTLAANNHPQGGAEFTVTLPATLRFV